MTALPGLPEGFTALHAGGATLIAYESLVTPLVELGFQAPEGWSQRMVRADSAPGRGLAGNLQVQGASLILKQMRRGGAVGALWRDRYPGRTRLLNNLLVPLAVARRGIATAEPVALLLVMGPPGLYRGWLATRRIEDAVDLARRFTFDDPPSTPQLRAVAALVKRMHDAGVDHPDLNLGNVMLRDGASGPEAFVIDLDRVRLRNGPLPFARRQRAVRRLERSFLKLFGTSGAPDWYELYAAGESSLREGFRRGRPVGRLLQRLHRFGWRS